MRIMDNIIVLVCFILIMFVNQSFGTQNFTEMAIGSRTYAMGQSATISYIDFFGSLNFPANLSQSKNINSALYYSAPLKNTKNMRFGFSIPLKGHGTIGFNYFHFIMDDIIWRNSNGESEGTASYIQHEYVISYGRKFADNVLFGINAKWITDEYTNVAQGGSGQKNIGLDFSVGYLPNFNDIFFKGFGIGFAFKNLIQVNTNDDYIPKEYRVIAENRYVENKSTLHLAINYVWYEYFSEEYETRFHVGLEYGYDLVFFRIGYNDDWYTAGAGVKFNNFTFDYGYGTDSNDNYFVRDQHNFTLNVQF